MNGPLPGWLQETLNAARRAGYLTLLITRSPRTILSRPERHPSQPILPSAFSITLTSSGSRAFRLVATVRLLGRAMARFLVPGFLAAFFVGMKILLFG